MKVVVAGPLPPTRGGIAQHTAGVIDGFTDLGFEVAAVTWRSQYPSFLYPGGREPHVEVYAHDASADLHWAQPWSWSRGGRRARSASLLVLPWVTPVQAVPIAALIGAARPTETAVIVHNALPHERHVLDVPITKWVLKKVSGAVVHSQAVARDLATIVPELPTAKVGHPPNLIVPPTELPLSNGLRFLFVGMIRPYKGLDLAIEAMAILREDNVEASLTIAGEFWEPIEKYQRLITELNLEHFVTLVPGYMPDTSLSRLIQSHHVVLLPYRSATQSGLVPIALGAKRPVIASDVGGLAEEIEDRETGLLVEPESVEALTDAMKEMSGAIGSYAENLSDWTPPTWSDVARCLLDVSNPF